MYTAASLDVIREFVKEKWLDKGIELSMLDDAARPAVVTLLWGGNVVDMYSTAGLSEHGFEDHYPASADGSNADVPHSDCQAKAQHWRSSGHWHGVFTRSATRFRCGCRAWPEDPPEDRDKCAEVAIFVEWTGLPTPEGLAAPKLVSVDHTQF